MSDDARSDAKAVEQTPQTPAQILAGRISERLKTEKLVLDEDSQKLGALISTGKVKGSDWRLAIEKAVTKQESK